MITARTPHRESGFSLVELLVTLVLVSLVLGGAFAMFNYTNKLSRAQIHQSDLQQSGRVAQRELLRYLRMAGRGGLPGFAVAGDTAASFPASVTPAISLRNNVPADTKISLDNNDSDAVLEGTDVLTVRGHFNSPPLFVDFTNPATFAPVGGAGGSVVVASHVAGSVFQDLSALIEAIRAGRPDALLLVSNLSDEIYGVAQLNPGGSDLTGVPDPYEPDPTVQFTITVAYQVGNASPHAAAYDRLSADGVFPDSALMNRPDWVPPRDLTGVGMVALLEEYRYYIREPEPDEGGAPRLSRARFYPGTEEPHPDGGYASDLADNIYDLQVALGFDSSYDGNGSSDGHFAADLNNTGPDDVIFDADVEATGDTATDDWLFNDAGDTSALTSLPWSPNSAAGSTPPTFTNSQPRPRLYYARVTTLAMAARPDGGYQADELTDLEDHQYALDDDDIVNNLEGRSRRRLLLTTIADLRNL